MVKLLIWIEETEEEKGATLYPFPALSRLYPRGAQLTLCFQPAITIHGLSILLKISVMFVVPMWPMETKMRPINEIICLNGRRKYILIKKYFKYLFFVFYY